MNNDQIRKAGTWNIHVPMGPSYTPMTGTRPYCLKTWEQFGIFGLVKYKK